VLSGATRVAGVIGDPVEHSLSPALHNAAFGALDLDWVYVAFPVAAGRGAQAVAAMRSLGVAGLSVTMPHKTDVLGSLDRLSATAARLGAVNTISWLGGKLGGELIGESTDGPGLVDAIRHDEGFDPRGKTAMVLGAGGAARAVVLSLAEAGAATVIVVARRAEAARVCAMLAGPVGRVGVIEEADGVDLIVNATPVGMTGTPTAPLPGGLDPTRLGPGQLVVDLVYAPAVTPLLAAARSRGTAASNGLGMLIHQAARQVAIWTGQEPPLEVMSAAAVAQLAHRSTG
jgi:shikimate dehydrogenase